MKKALCVAGFAFGAMLVFGGSTTIGIAVMVGALFAMDAWT